MGKRLNRKFDPSPLLLSQVKNRKFVKKNKCLRMCLKKMKKISDPESKLCKTSLIKNTLHRLQSYAVSDMIVLNMNTDHDQRISSKYQTSIKKEHSELPSKSIEEILSDIIQPPPFISQLEESTFSNFKDVSEPVSERIGERLDEERIEPASEAFTVHSDDAFITELCNNPDKLAFQKYAKVQRHLIDKQTKLEIEEIEDDIDYFLSSIGKNKHTDSLHSKEASRFDSAKRELIISQIIKPDSRRC